MASTQKTESALLKKVWDIANVLSAAGVGFTDYITQLTYILFLKMDDEKESMGLPSYLPEGYKWKDLCSLSGTDPILSKLADKYRVTLIDFLGGGRSDRVEKWPADLWFDWGCQAKALCDHLGLKKVKLIGSSGGALAAFNFALEYPGYVDSFIADSFEGLKADPGIMEQLISGRAQAKTSGGFVKYLKSLHGDDWEQVFDADTDAVVRHAEQIGVFFHKPVEELKVPVLLTGSLEDDMFPKGHCRVLFDEICAKTTLAKTHIFEHGRHPAMLSNMDEFIKLC